MCCRPQIWSIVLTAFGAGLVLSCLFDGWVLCFILGAVLIAAGILVSQGRA